jgi:hypothetical protein
MFNILRTGLIYIRLSLDILAGQELAEIWQYPMLGQILTKTWWATNQPIWDFQYVTSPIIGQGRLLLLLPHVEMWNFCRVSTEFGNCQHTAAFLKC